MDQLKTRFNDASRKKRFLEEEIKGLKDQVLLHSRCDDEAIRIYISRMVKQVTKHGLMSTVSTEEDVAGSFIVWLLDAVGPRIIFDYVLLVVLLFTSSII